MINISQQVEDFKKKLTDIQLALNLDEKEKRIAKLESESKAEGFWNDAQKAGKIMQEIESLKKETERIIELEKKLEEIEEFSKIAKNAEEEKDIETELANLKKEINDLEFNTLLGGPYDRNDAIISIHSGAGGVDAQDWAEMLLRMFLRFAEKNNFKAKIIDESRGQEAGIKNASVEISGPYAYGYLKSEAGTHRLVRLSPFNANNLRQTSFALVEVLPIIEEIKEVQIDPKDLRIDTYRSSGAGGQHVNVTDSAVRITHIPTGIIASCQNERSQTQNKEQAMKMLKAKLHLKFLEEQEKERKKMRGENISAEWGSQIRSYVLHPYKLVKDHRTQWESANPDAVLDGDLKEFMEAYLKNTKK